MTDQVRTEWGVGAGVELDVIGPLGGEASVDLSSTTPESWCKPGLLQSCKDAWRTGTLSHPVAYRNRFANDDAQAGTGLPGVHYVRIQYGLRENINVPYTLTIKTVGEDGTGEPDYEKVSGLSAPTADPNLNADLEKSGKSGKSDGSGKSDKAGGSGADTDGGSGADASGSGDTVKLVAGVGGVGLGLAALVAAVVLLIRRRRV